MASDQLRVGFFVTCLVDMMRPNIGFASIRLLEQAGCNVEVPEAQTCCGQPAYNNGDNKDAVDIAKQVIAVFEQYDYVVAPSGSCIGTMHEHYPRIFESDSEWFQRARDFSTKCHEITSFLTDVVGIESVSAEYLGDITYHDSCSGMRELGIKEQPRKLLKSIDGLKLKELGNTEACCGFGGTFCVKYPDISERLVDDKISDIKQTGATTLVGGDLGCLMNIEGRLSRLNEPVKVYHVVEVLAGMTGQKE